MSWELSLDPMMPLVKSFLNANVSYGQKSSTGWPEAVHTLCSNSAHALSAKAQASRSDREQAKRRLLKHRKKLVKDVAAYNLAAAQYNQSLAEASASEGEHAASLPVLPNAQHLSSVLDLPAGFPATAEPLRRSAVYAYMQLQRLNEEIASITNYDLPQLALVLARRRVSVAHKRRDVETLLAHIESLLLIESSTSGQAMSPTTSELPMDGSTDKIAIIRDIISDLLVDGNTSLSTRTVIADVEKYMNTVCGRDGKWRLRQAYVLVSGLQTVLAGAMHMHDRVRDSGVGIPQFWDATWRYEMKNGGLSRELPCNDDACFVPVARV